MEHFSNLLVVIGRFHPLVLHFPIGLIAGVAGLELWMLFRPGSDLRPATGMLLALASISAVVAAVCGLLLARSGGYDEGLLVRHRLFGVATAFLAFAALMFHRRLKRSSAGRRAALYHFSLAACVIATAAAGHYGGIITHGSKTPFGALIKLLRGESDGSQVTATDPAVIDDELLPHSALPILESHCFECHGAEKQKSGLRLDTREAALAGGESGKPAIVPASAMASRMVEAITLPEGNKRAMPPTGKRRLEPREVLLLIDWINHGALWPDKEQLRPAGVAPPSAAAMEQLRANGFQLAELARGHPLVRVDSIPKGARLSALAPVAQQIAWLNLSSFELEGGELQVLADMPHLTRLELQHSNVRDGDLANVAKLEHLAVLNLYGTQIGDAGLSHLRDLRSLERLYVWQTQVTRAGVQALQEALPTARIDMGDVDADAK